MLEVLADAAVLLHLVLNHLEAVQNGRVVAPAELRTDGGGGHFAQVVCEVDRHVARKGDVGRPARADEFLMGDVVVFFHHRLDGVDVDDLVRCIEVLVCDTVDVLARQLTPLRLALARHARAPLAKALQLADVRARDLGHVPQLVVGKVPLVYLQRGQQGGVDVHVRQVARAHDDVLVIALEDRVLHLKAGVRDQAEHARVESAGEALVQAELFGCAVGCDDDLLAVADELVHQLEEEFDGGLAADDVLDVVDDQDIGVAVLAHDRLARPLLHAELTHVVVDVDLRAGVLNPDVGLFLGQVVFDGEQQVGLAQAGVTVDEQRRALSGLIREGGEAQGTLVCVLVLVAEDEIFEREL